MTENATHLENVMNSIEALETTIALNNLIAAGLVTDPEVIADAHLATQELLTMQLMGIRLMFSDDPEMKAAILQAVALTQD